MKETFYLEPKNLNGHCEHKYGKNVRIIADPLSISLLAKLGAIETEQPQVNDLVVRLYRILLDKILCEQFKLKQAEIKTRMYSSHKEEGVFRGLVLDSEQDVVTVNIARAGTLPSHVFYDELNRILNPKKVRQDHISINRVTNESQQVVGTNLSGHKIGGLVDDTTVLIPDPMGATGSTIISVIKLYKEKYSSLKNTKFITAHLIITPEYIKNVLSAHPDVMIYAIRLDRGLSSSKVEGTVLGEYFDLEKGLNEFQYIVPGAGGLGELLNNSYT
jgi:uracil phosphoribosyltransferase